MALSPVDYPTLAIYPGTLTDLTVVSNWADLSITTYTLADADRTNADYPGALIIILSDLTGSRLARSTTTVTISSTGCQTQTLQITDADWYEITMEPAQGYKKLYAYSLSKAASVVPVGTTESAHDYIYLTAETLEESDGIAYDANGNPWGGTLKTVSTGLAYSRPYDAHSGGGSND